MCVWVWVVPTRPVVTLIAFPNVKTVCVWASVSGTKLEATEEEEEDTLSFPERERAGRLSLRRRRRRYAPVAAANGTGSAGCESAAAAAEFLHPSFTLSLIHI